MTRPACRLPEARCRAAVCAGPGRTAQWVRAGWLIDGQGTPPAPKVLMAVHEGRFVYVGPDDPQQPVAVDLSHATVLPALIDAHVHLVFSGTFDPQIRKTQLHHCPRQACAAIRRHLEDHRRCGISAVRDGGDRRGDVLQYKRNLHGGQPGVHVAATQWAWHAAGRYGGMIGQAPPDGSAPGTAVQANLAGSDHIKLIQSGLNSLDRFGWQGGPQFQADDLADMVRAGHAARRSVMIHANGEQPVRMALEAGCDSIEHGYFMGDDNLRRMADRGAVWVPTAVPMAALTAASGLTAHQQDVARRTLETQLDQVRKARQWGVSIALGTDAGSIGVAHGHAVRRELALLMQAGMGLEEALGCATATAAKLLGLDDRGVLRLGQRADFIAVPGSPDRLPEGLAAIERICMGGQWLPALDQ